jgi:DNA-binding NtrC family response regulator
MKKNILIIDDEERIREIYARLFHAIGSTIFEVFEASNAEEAKEIIFRERLDLILLDIKMPRIDGIKMFEAIKEVNPRLEIVVASVYPIEKQKKLIPFADSYYDKSEGPIKLLEKVTARLLLQPM